MPGRPLKSGQDRPNLLQARIGLAANCLPVPCQLAFNSLPERCQSAARAFSKRCQIASKSLPEMPTPTRTGCQICACRPNPVFRPLGRCAPFAVNSGLRPETRPCWPQSPEQAGPRCARERVASTPSQRVARGLGSARAAEKEGSNAPTRRYCRLPR